MLAGPLLKSKLETVVARCPLVPLHFLSRRDRLKGGCVPTKVRPLLVFRGKACNARSAEEITQSWYAPDLKSNAVPNTFCGMPISPYASTCTWLRFSAQIRWIPRKLPRRPGRIPSETFPEAFYAPNVNRELSALNHPPLELLRVEHPVR